VQHGFQNAELFASHHQVVEGLESGVSKPLFVQEEELNEAAGCCVLANVEVSALCEATRDFFRCQVIHFVRLERYVNSRLELRLFLDEFAVISILTWCKIVESARASLVK